MNPDEPSSMPVNKQYQIIGADGREYGPVELEIVRQWLLQKRANGKTLIQIVGNNAWTPLEQIPEFAALIAVPSAPSGPPPLNPTAMPGGKPADTYLIPAILLTLCCCLPLGGVAMFYAAMAGKHNAGRNYVTAETAAQRARKWCWIAFIVGAVLLVGYSLAIAALLMGA